MGRRAAVKDSAEKPAKKTKSSAGGGKKKLSAFNRFMKSEMSKLKDTEPNLTHQERFKLATQHWKTAEENPNRSG